MSEEEILYNQLYEKTKDFGRTQFVREIQMQINANKMQINANKKLEKENKQLKERIDKAVSKLKKLDEIVDITNDMYARMTYITKINNTIKILEGESNE